MDQSAITVRYAKAFFELAKEKNLLEPLKADIELVASVGADSADFILLLESPIVKTSKKIELITAIFQGSVNELTLNFLNLIAKKQKRSAHSGNLQKFPCTHPERSKYKICNTNNSVGNKY